MSPQKTRDWPGIIALVGALALMLASFTAIAQPADVAATAESGAPLAPPPLPFSPFGTVLVNGSSVAVGTVISAWCGGVSYRQTLAQLLSGVTWYFNLGIFRATIPTRLARTGARPMRQSVSKLESFGQIKRPPGSPALRLSSTLPRHLPPSLRLRLTHRPLPARRRQP